VKYQRSYKYIFSIVFNLIGTVAFDIFGPMHVIHESHMTPFPTILTLRDTWVHIYSSNCYNVTSDIGTSVNEVFYPSTTLRVPDIDPNYSYIRFGRHFDDLGSRHENSVVKNVSTFDHYFYDICCDRKISIFNKVEDT